MINKIKTKYPLKNLTTFQIGGDADYFIEIQDILAMQEILIFCKYQKLPYFILGKGSNILFDDKGFRGMVIANRISFIHKPNPHIWHIGAGYSFSLLGSQTAREGWAGLEFASGIPGSVGGAIYMNAGANGCETSHSLISVDFVNLEGKLLSLPKEAISFGYRTSSFQNQEGAIVGAMFSLTPCCMARKKQLELLRYRQKTQPYKAKSAGSVFCNPPSHSAGALIETCGLKGKVLGGAQISPIHANFITNIHQASSQDVINLSQSVMEEVKKKHDIELQFELKYISYER